MAIISCSNRSLPRSLDINISISRPQSETTTDLSVPVFVTPEGSSSVRHGAGRISYYSTQSALEDAVGTTGERFKAGRDFFAQPTRARTMAIGQVYTTPQPGILVTGSIAAIATFTPVTDGSFTISIDGDSQNIASLDFSSSADLDGVATVIQTALRAVASGGYTLATCEHENGQLVITSGTTGDSSRVTVMTAGTSGTDISGEGFLNGQNGTVTDGYTPTGLAGELALIAEAARCSGRFVYGWDLDVSYRDTTDQADAAAWALARTSIFSATSNSILAYDAGNTSDIGSVLNAAGNFRAFAFYHDNPNYYPGMAMMAIMLSVNYALANSTITAKFKDLIGIPTVGIDETQLTVLQNKRYNTFVRIGNDLRSTRDGVNSHSSWFMDDLINLDNYKEEMEVAFSNMFHRNGKVPLTVAGQAISREPAEEINTRYETNGTFADRRVTDSSEKSGFRIIPATEIVATDIGSLTDADRASRIGPPMTINAQLAGAIHSLSVSVNAFS